MFKYAILICALNVHLQDCTKKTAINVLETPAFDGELKCLIGSDAQGWLAKLAIKPIEGREYSKIGCERVKE